MGGGRDPQVNDRFVGAGVVLGNILYEGHKLISIGGYKPTCKVNCVCGEGLEDRRKGR